MRLRFLAALSLAALMAAFSFSASPEAIRDTARQASIQLSVQRPDGSFHNFCSAVAIAPHYLATAQHCAVVFQTRMVYMGPNRESGPRHLVFVDDGDTAIFWTEHEWSVYAPMARRPPQDYEHVFQWGFPEGLNSELYREGVFAGVWYSTDQAFDGVAGRTVWLWDLDSGHGDSGSGIFDQHGKVICILSFGIHPPLGSFALTGCYVPLFSEQVWETIYGR